MTKPHKAVYAFIMTFVGALLATVQGRTDVDSMKAVDWIIVIGSALVVAGGVYQVNNPPKR